MIIERVQVDGGFLRGVDLHLTPGLITLIGGRGVGKTSIIELVRFCLDVPSPGGPGAEEDARRHALQVLRDGEVTVTLLIGSQRVTVSRTVADEEPRASAIYDVPIIFAQKEIETVGLDPHGRLKLLDEFLDQSEALDERRVFAKIRSYTKEISSLSEEVRSLTEKLSAEPNLKEELVEVRREQKALSASARIKKKQVELAPIAEASSAISVRLEAILSAKQTTENWLEMLEGIIRLPPQIDNWPSAAGGNDPLHEIRRVLGRSVVSIKATIDNVRQLTPTIAELTKSAQEERAGIQSRARAIRTEVEHLKEGAGEVEKRLANLHERLAQLEFIHGVLSERKDRLKQVSLERASLLNELDSLRSKRFALRDGVAQHLTSELRNSVRITVQASAMLSGYVDALTAALRGSGLKYGDLVHQVAQSITPRELAEAAENGDVTFIAETVKITEQRASRIVEGLDGDATSDILTCPLEDDVTLELLDGSEFKVLEGLSIGQRCTVVLPIILEHKNRVVMLDQPEDHLDNAFIVDTLVRSIRNRGGEGQIIVSTHNANIPVLGDANQVVLLGSDGRRGFISHAAPLEDDRTVQAITSVMEGGEEAFSRRASFYGLKG